MKWVNPGKEYIKYEKIFKGKNIYIYGAAAKGAYLYNRIKKYDCVAGFIDNNPQYMNKCYLGKPVIRFRMIDENFKRNNIIILAVSKDNTMLFLNQCRSIGFVDGENLFYCDDFMNYYIDLYLYFRKGLIFSEFISLQVTSVCNLNCVGCLAFNPQNKKQRHFEIEAIEKSIDLVFKNVDYVHILDVCGGEPFLFKGLPNVIRYIANKYSERIEVLRTVSNGTVIPSDELCKALNKYNVTVLLDDYRDVVEQSKKNYCRVVEKLKEYNVTYIVNKVEYWIDLGVGASERTSGVGDEIMLHDECQDNRRTVLENKMYACDYAGYAVASNVIENAEYLDLNNVGNKAIMLEFLKGYTKSGNAGMCKYCNGCMNVNRNYIGVAEQSGD